MKKWLQRTVGTASIACGIALAASGIATAGTTEIGDPLGTVGSLPSVTDAGSVTDLAGGTPVGSLPTDNPVGMVPDASQLTGQVSGVTGDLPGKKVVGKVTKPAKPEGLPVADGLPVVGGLTQGGLPVAGGGGTPLTGANTDAVDNLPLVGNMTGSVTKPVVVPGKPAGKPAAKKEKALDGMGADLVGSKILGKGAVGGLRGDVTRPAEDLPLVGQLPVVGQLGNAVPMGSTPLGVDAPAPKK